MIDLHIKLKNKEILYDYKSGVLKNKKGEEKKEKVDNAFKQLDYYSIMLSERNSQEIEKFVVDVWNGDIMDDKRKEEEEFLNEDDILKVVKKYYETDYYDIGDVKDISNLHLIQVSEKSGCGQSPVGGDDRMGANSTDREASSF